MIVRADQRWLSEQCHTRFFGNLAGRRCLKLLARINTACGHLGARLGMISVCEDQQLTAPLDIDHDSLTTLHLPNRRLGGGETRLCQRSGMTPEANHEGRG